MNDFYAELGERFTAQLQREHELDSFVEGDLSVTISPDPHSESVSWDVGIYRWTGNSVAFTVIQYGLAENWAAAAWQALTAYRRWRVKEETSYWGEILQWAELNERIPLTFNRARHYV